MLKGWGRGDVKCKSGWWQQQQQAAWGAVSCCLPISVLIETQCDPVLAWCWHTVTQRQGSKHADTNLYWYNTLTLTHPGHVWSYAGLCVQIIFIPTLIAGKLGLYGRFNFGWMQLLRLRHCWPGSFAALRIFAAQVKSIQLRPGLREQSCTFIILFCWLSGGGQLQVPGLDSAQQ